MKPSNLLAQGIVAFVSMGLLTTNVVTFAAESVALDLWPHDPGPLAPFGSPNPAQTDPRARIFDSFIGIHDCAQERIDYATRKVSRAKGVWVWYYDMNGFGIRDHYRFGAGAPVSQRVFDPATGLWHVWYLLGQAFYFADEWVGGQVEDRLVFENPKQMLGDAPALSRVEFFDLTARTFKWRSSNIRHDNGESFIDWTITCTRRSP